MTTWFESLFGFAEADYPSTQERFTLEETTLTSRVNGRAFGVGSLETPSVGTLRARAHRARPGVLRVSHDVVGDVLELHARPENAGAMFQVASQLNCLEFAGPDETPEDGVTFYADDPTQGPACSLAAAAATVYRNYFAPVGGARGQRRERQLDNLDDVQRALGDPGQLVTVRNGYTFSDESRLAALGPAVERVGREALIGHMKIGVQSGVEVTFASRYVPPSRPAFVSQAFCSALSCGYNPLPIDAWEPLATVVLDAAYEATLWAAAIDAHEGRGSGVVWLTFLGGGVFGNRRAWIARAIRRALHRARDYALEVHIAHYRRLDEEIREIIDAP